MKYQNFFLLCGSLLIALCLGEILLRFVYPSDAYKLLFPNTVFEISPKKFSLIGLNDHVTWNINRQGYRGALKLDNEQIGIGAIGASTTECAMINEDNTWCKQLENKLNDTLPLPNVCIGNFGKSGLNSAHHLLQLQHLPEQFENIQIIVLLVGINDYMRALSMGNDYFPAEEDPALIKTTFAHYPKSYNEWFFQRTAWWMALRKLKREISINYLQADPKKITQKMNALKNDYLNSEKTDILPDLTIPLLDYEKSLRKFAALTKQLDKKSIWLTQPVIWQENMDEFTKTLGTPMIANKNLNHYSPKALFQGMERYNERLKKVAQEEDIPVVDLSKILPKDTTVFYDYCHFNILGNAQVNEAVYPTLLEMMKEVRE